MSDMHFFGKRVLFIGAHPDDIELGCGALILSISLIPLRNNVPTPQGEAYLRQ